MSKRVKTENENILLYDDHKFPTTRREFLTQGLIGVATAITPPLLMSSNVRASELACANDGLCGVPYLCIEGAGGMNIPGGNAMVGFSADEDPTNFGNLNLSDYFTLGLSKAQHPSVSAMNDDTYGIRFHSTSGILDGMNSVLAEPLDGVDLRQAVDGVLFCTRTSDDSANNPLNTLYAAQRAGAKGKLVQLVGDTNTDSGARSPSPQKLVDLSKRPSNIRNFKNGEGLLSINDTLMNEDFLKAGEAGGTSRMKDFLKRVAKVSDTNFRGIASHNSAATKSLKNAAFGTEKIFDKFNPSTLNPLNVDAKLNDLVGAFGGDAMAKTVENEKVASIANLVTDRIAGAGSIVVGGCDYHTGDSTRGNNKDREIGVYIGKCIRLAAIRGVPLFIHLYTDGGVVGDRNGALDETDAGKGRVIWTSDSGTRSASLVLVFQPGHNRSVDGDLILNSKKSDGKARTRQVGHFRKGGGVELTATSISNAVDKIWIGIMLNYLSFSSTKTDDDAIIADAIEKFKERFPFQDLPDDAKDLIRLKAA